MSLINVDMPSLSEIRERMQADLEFRLPATQERPAKSVLAVFVAVISAAISALYAFGGWISRQIDPLQADISWLEVWALRLNVPRKSATYAQATVHFSGSGEIPKETRIRNAVTGKNYITLTNVVPSVPVTIESVEPGSASDLTDAAELVLETPITGVDMTVELLSVDANGEDEESQNSWASRIAERIAERQQVGDDDDYIRWAKASHTAIYDASVAKNTPNLGEVTLYVLGYPDQPVLSDAVLTVAQENITGLRNMGAQTRLLAVGTQPVHIRIADVPEAVRDDILTAINTLFASRATFNAQIWTEEIERIVANYASGFTLLEPIAKQSSDDKSILVQGDIQWL